MDRIESEIQRTLAEATGRRPRAADSLTDLGLDSLRMAELAVQLESEFGIEADEELLEVETVTDLAEYVRSRTSR